MNQDLRAALGGAVAGTVATLPMSVVMVAAKRAGLLGEHPPTLIAAEGLRSAGAHPSEATKASAGTALHFAFGAVTGALFGLVHHHIASDVDSPGPRFARGIGYGLLVYTASYAGWVPAVGIMPTPAHDRRGRPSAMIAAHVVFGVALAALVSVLVPPKEQGEG